jgi:hypothetical protein
MISHPGSSTVEAIIFDESGRILWADEFTVGWREYFHEAKVERSNLFTSPIIKISTNDTQQFFAVLPNRLALLRIEYNKKATRNLFFDDYVRYGPMVPERTAGEWLAALNSKNLPVILEALTWLGGKHSHLHLEPEYMLVAKVRAGANKRLKVLAHSKNEWIREAAEQALHPNDENSNIKFKD